MCEENRPPINLLRPSASVSIEYGNEPITHNTTDKGFNLIQPNDLECLNHPVALSGHTSRVAEAYRLFHAGATAPSDSHSTKFSEPWALNKTPLYMSGAAAEITLRPYQLHAVNRLLCIFDKFRGGLLALEMGLGKTIVTIVLICELLKRERDSLGYIHHLSSSLGLPEERLAGGVLIVAPLSVLSVWKEEFERRLKSHLRILVYHPSTNKEPKTINTLASYDVVITSPNILRSEYAISNPSSPPLQPAKKQKKGRSPPAPIYPICVMSWLMVVVDEAHSVTNKDAAITDAVHGLLAKYRLLVTGTPIMNEYNNVQSIMRVLRIMPWDDWTFFDSVFYRKPSVKDSGIVGGANILPVDLNAILATSIKAFTVSMRRESLFDNNRLLQIPDSVMYDVFHDLRPEERTEQDWYLVKRQWDIQTRRQWQADRQSGKCVGDPSERFRILPELTCARLALTHPKCSQAEYDAEANEEEVEDTSVQDRISKQRRRFISSLRDNWRSTRLLVTVGIIQRQLKQRESKIAVFSDFLCALDALSVALDENKISYARFDGTMGKDERDATIKRFQEKNQEHVILITSRSGGFGIDLTRADTVILLNQSWNPAIAGQCKDRVVRHGQTKEVSVYTLHARASVDIKTSAAQEVKMLKASMLLDPDPALRKAMSKLASWDREKFDAKLTEARENAAKLKAISRKRQPGTLARLHLGGPARESNISAKSIKYTNTTTSVTINHVNVELRRIKRAQGHPTSLSAATIEQQIAGEDTLNLDLNPEIDAELEQQLEDFFL